MDSVPTESFSSHHARKYKRTREKALLERHMMHANPGSWNLARIKGQQKTCIDTNVWAWSKLESEKTNRVDRLTHGPVSFSQFTMKIDPVKTLVLAPLSRQLYRWFSARVRYFWFNLTGRQYCPSCASCLCGSLIYPSVMTWLREHTSLSVYMGSFFLLGFFQTVVWYQGHWRWNI